MLPNLFNITFLKFILFFCIGLVITSCQSETSEKELELRERELRIRELELSQQANNNSSPGSNNSEIRPSYTTKKNSNNSSSEQSLRAQLEQKERKNPSKYLSVTYDLNYKVFSGKDEVKGTIYNSASFATYKDIELVVTYSSKTGTVLYTESSYVYEYVYPGSSTYFSFKTYSPEGTKYIGVKIKSASYE